MLCILTKRILQKGLAFLCDYGIMILSTGTGKQKTFKTRLTKNFKPKHKREKKKMKKEYRVNFMTAADYAKNCANDYARVNSQAVIVTAENAEQATEQVKAMFPTMVVFQGVDLEQEKEYNNRKGWRNHK